MHKLNLRRLLYRLRHEYMTLNNVVIAVAFIIAASWIWGSLGVMQRNYALQKELDSQKQQLELNKLETDNARLEQTYYKSSEYQELIARKDLGLALPGEKVLVLPPNSQAAIDADNPQATVASAVAQDSNLEQWINFLFGGDNKNATS
jgi:cell division protein FtsB